MSIDLPQTPYSTHIEYMQSTAPKPKELDMRLADSALKRELPRIKKAHELAKLYHHQEEYDRERVMCEAFWYGISPQSMADTITRHGRVAGDHS